jgi:MFS family permease
VAGFEKDTGLSGNQFYYSLTIFYIFYILVEIPSNEIFRKVGSMWLAFLVIVFGVVSIATAFIHTLGGVIATRVFLGLAEGGRESKNASKIEESVANSCCV